MTNFDALKELKAKHSDEEIIARAKELGCDWMAVQRDLGILKIQEMVLEVIRKEEM